MGLAGVRQRLLRRDLREGRVSRRPLRVEGVADRERSVARARRRRIRTGQGLAGYSLGEQTSNRDHLGAIDPVHGKSLEWPPGSNSYEGNKAMLDAARCHHRRGCHHPGRLERRPRRVLRLQQRPRPTDPTDHHHQPDPRPRREGRPRVRRRRQGLGDERGSTVSSSRSGTARRPVPAGQPHHLGCGQHDRRRPRRAGGDDDHLVAADHHLRQPPDWLHATTVATNATTDPTRHQEDRDVRPG